MKNKIWVTIIMFCAITHVWGQTDISGSVVTEDNQPLPGVSIIVKGTTRGTTTDFDGNFKIEVSNNAILEFSYIGFSTKEVSVNEPENLRVVMIEDASQLDEVVVVGYGSVRRSDLTGSVSSLKNEEIAAFPTANVMQSLSGRAPGVQVKQNTGAPGAGVSVRIRGTNSIQGSNEPLYVIDGFPYSGSNPTIISNTDIESVEILKDASATAIYGSRGANGVVLITTKRGKQGATTIDFESSYGIQSLRKQLDLMSASEYAQFYNEQAVNDGQEPYFSQSEIDSFGRGYDWQGLVFSSAPIKNNMLSINGGNEKTKFSVSGTIFNQEGIIKGSDYNRYSVRTFISHEINKVLAIDFGATLTKNRTDRQNSAGGNRGGTLIGASISSPPTLTPYNEDGSYTVLATSYPFISNAIINPLNFIHEQTDRAEANIVLANAAIKIRPVEGLELKFYGGVENNDLRTDFYRTLDYINSQGYASVGASNNLSLLSENTISYNKVFNNVHSLSAVAGFTYQDFVNKSLSGSGTGFLSDVTETFNLSSAEAPGVSGSGYSKSVLLSYLGRINYAFDNKYLLTASIRADGSSKYSEGNKWGYFPSGAIAWKVKEEEFLKNSEVISDMKLRASYGYTGSQAISAYSTLNQLSSGKTIFGDALYNTFSPSTRLPGDLKWETTEQLDFGLDFGILNNRFHLTADYYIKNTRDLLNTVVLPLSLGFSTTTRNVGQIRNKGWEFSLDANIFNGDFQWDINANLAFNRSKVIKLNDGQDILAGRGRVVFINDNTSLIREGEPLSVFYGYLREEGYDENGREVYQDLSGPDGTPDGLINQFDKTIIGDPNPDFIYGLNSVMNYKNVELTFFLQGSQGNDIVNISSIGNTLDYGYGLNMLKEVYDDHWTPTNVDAKYPAITRSQNMRYSDRFVEDGSFLRLRNIQLGYHVPCTQMGLKWLRNLQLYISGQNLLTFTKYSWWDPEVNSQGGSNSLGQGIDHYSYPTSKTVTFGVKVGL